tara:strand:+ start:235 stop:462 length:228 start_codon:yes stop_codon:yes gene_type:complete
MDICFVEREEDIQIFPQSILGTLWLQTHFPSDHWEALTENLAIIDKSCRKELFEDVRAAGLKLNFIENLCTVKNF